MTPRPDPDRHAVCVFTASADSVSDRFRAQARAVGSLLAEHDWRLVYGGGKAGLMGEVAQACLSAGGKVTGIIPERLHTRERAFDAVDDLITVDTLAERKIIMEARSDVFLVLPGGIGTLDELLEVLTTRHLGYHDYPIVLLDTDGYWDSFHMLLANMVTANLLPQASADLLVTVDHLDNLAAAIGPRP